MRDLIQRILVLGITLLMVGITFTSVPLNASAESSDFSGGDGTVSNPYQISDCNQLQNMKLDLDANYILIDDIDCTATTTWNSGAGFEPVGTLSDPFLGNFFGNGFVIENLYINRPSSDFIGLFGYIYFSDISNAALENIDITGSSRVGGLVGYNAYGTVSDSYASGVVIGTTGAFVGGLLGYNYYSCTISNCYADVSVTGSWCTGGLAGYVLYGSTVTESYSTGDVYSPSTAGGLIGANLASVSRCYATGDVSGTNAIGGFAGWHAFSNTISNCYATGSVTGYSKVGGMIGENWYAYLENSYATGSITGTVLVGGLTGNGGAISNSYWDVETTGQLFNIGGTGKTTAEMMQQATFAGWDFDNIWRIKEDITYPYFKWQQTPSEALEDLISEIEDMLLHSGIENSLVSKLENAKKSIDKEQDNAALNQIKAFINQVEAQKGKKLTAEEANSLIEYAQWIIERLTS